jgi:hypothetical protein
MVVAALFLWGFSVRKESEAALAERVGDGLG